MDILTNLLKARELVFNHTPGFFSLADFKKETDCGTLFCTAGLISQDAHFIDQGVVLLDGYVYVPWLENTTFTSPISSADADKIFGIHCWSRLFCSRLNGVWDEQIIEDYQEKRYMIPNDRSLALARLDRQIAEYQK